MSLTTTGSSGASTLNTTTGVLNIPNYASGAAWGSITGTLSTQTDLNTALTDRALLTGATFTGAVTANNLRVTSATIPANGMYLESTNQIGFGTNSLRRATLDAAGELILGSGEFSGDSAAGLVINTTQSSSIIVNSTNPTVGVVFIAGGTQVYEFFANAGGAFGVYNETNSTFPLAISGGGTTTRVRTHAQGTFGFSNSFNDARDNIDTGISRVSANVMAFGNGTQGNVTAELRAGHIKSMVVGRGFFVAEGSNARMGRATLVGGTILVSNTAVSANTRIFLSVFTAGGTQGHLSYTQVNATSFTINSTSATDTSIINWLIMEAS